jgi:cation-transporting ATPase E
VDAEPVPNGLSSVDVAERIARGEVNRSLRRGAVEYRDLAARNLFTLFNALVVPAAVALFLLGEYPAAWAVSAMALVNTIIGLAQEIRAKRHLDALAILAEPRARVRRDGGERFIAGGEVVRDDLVLLSAGEAIVADGTVLTARYLEVDEALLTGESDPIARRPGDQLLSGSFCVAGEGSYRAERIGGEGFAQRLAAETREYRYAPSPMQHNLDTLIRVLTAIAVALCLLYVVLFYIRGFPADDLWQMIAATVTSMVPQGLVLMATVALTLGAVRLSARGAVVQRLSAVEAMASIDVLCMDKTGTLTTGRLTLDRVVAIGCREEDARSLLRRFAFASMDASNKTIAALRAALCEPGERLQVLDQVPFKSQNRYSAVRISVDGAEHTLALGAFEALAPGLEDCQSAEKPWSELVPTGLRLLLFAEARDTRDFASSLDGFTLRALAIVALSDELRPDAIAVLAELARQGIDFKVVSGDNPETVKATVAHLPLALAHKPVATGGDLETTGDRARLIREAAVFGRVAPHQKLDIVAELRRQGRCVGMIGDGVNDVLPIKRADLGISMGSGSSAARNVAGLVLENDDFTLLPQALAEGRAILHSLCQAAKLFLLKNVYTLLLIVAGLGVLRLGFPYLPQQVTLLNTLTIGGPVFLIVFGRRPAGTPGRTGFLHDVGWFALAAGFATGSAAMGVWLASAKAGDDEATQRTELLSTLVLTGLGNVLLISGGERRLVAWCAGALPAFLLCVYLAPLADFFALAPLAMRQWLAPVSGAAVALTICALSDRWLKSRSR